MIIKCEVLYENLQIKLINSIGVIEIDEFRISNLNQVEIETSKLKSEYTFYKLKGKVERISIKNLLSFNSILLTQPQP